MKDYKFIKFLKEKMIADAYQYYEACSYKIYLAEVSSLALENVISNYQKNETNVVEKVFEDAAISEKFFQIYFRGTVSSRERCRTDRPNYGCYSKAGHHAE